MKRKAGKVKKTSSIILALLMLLSVFPTAAFASEVKASGTYGSRIAWSLSDDGELTLSGTGSMSEGDTAEDYPWYSYKNEIVSLVVENGVTTIGKYAFDSYYFLKNISLPTSIKNFGNMLLRAVRLLKVLSYPKA